MKIMFRILTAIISSSIFSFLLALMEVTPLDKQKEGVYYFSFIELIIPYLLVITSIYFLFGIPLSFLFDFLIKKLRGSGKNGDYLYSVLFYIFGGVFVGALLAIEDLSYLYGITLFSIFGSLIFYHISILFNKALDQYKLFKKLK